MYDFHSENNFCKKKLYMEKTAILNRFEFFFFSSTEFYGTVEWSVKGIFCNYMGWFSGKASELHPMERLEQSKALVELAG